MCKAHKTIEAWYSGTMLFIGILVVAIIVGVITAMIETKFSKCPKCGSDVIEYNWKYAFCSNSKCNFKC